MGFESPLAKCVQWFWLAGAAGRSPETAGRSTERPDHQLPRSRVRQGLQEYRPRLVRRDRDPHRGALVRCAGRIDRAAVRLDDAARERQAEADAAGLARSAALAAEERGEDPG